MAYEKQTWANGDVITDEKLNHIEEGIAGCDRGYECAETTEELFAESVTAESVGPFYSGVLEYSEFIDADTILVEFDGTEYTVSKTTNAHINVYGDMEESRPIVPNYDRYPFVITSSEGDRNLLFAQTSGEHTIAVSVHSETVEVSDCFGKARGYYNGVKETEIFNDTITTAEVTTDDKVMNYYELDGTLISGETIKVTFDGINYNLDKTIIPPDDPSAYIYGDTNTEGPDFSRYPFVITTQVYEGEPERTLIYTQTAGDHSVVITAPITSTEVTDDFKNAVAQCSTGWKKVTLNETTWGELEQWVNSGMQIYVDVPMQSDSASGFTRAYFTSSHTTDTATSFYFCSGSGACVNIFRFVGGNEADILGKDVILQGEKVCASVS